MRKPFLLSLLVALLTSLSTHAYDFQSGDLYYNITSDTTVEVTYQEYRSESNYQGLTTATIPATVTNNGSTYSVTIIGDWAFSDCSSLTSITIPNSVTSIEKFAFADCSSLTSITIPNSVTSIGDYAFYDVPNIVYNGTATGSPWGARSVNGYVEDYLVYADETKTTLLACSAAATGEITIPNSVTSIGERAFSGCSSLTSITIPNSVMSIGNYVFWGCSSLTSITLPNSVTSIGEGAFYDCSSLTSITLPNSVTSIGSGAFAGCSSLTSIVVESGNTMYDSRENCNAIIETASNTLIAGCQSTTIPNSVTSIGDYAFYDCTSLTSINIPNSVTSIGDYAFYDCTSLTSITIGNSVTSIGDWAFQECSSLTSITIGNSVTSIGSSAFDGCSSLTSVVWNAKNCEDWYYEYPPFYDICANITSFTFGEEVVTIPSFLCEGMSSLTSITIPNSVTSIGYGAFAYCSSLTSITCLATTPPTCGNYCFYTVPRTIPLYVPAESVEEYKAADTWKEFDVQALLSTDATETASDKGATKLLRDGQVLIILNGETYNMTGQRL